jgi:hypothetical protein
MKEYYVIKDLRDNSYVSYNEELGKDISSAMEFENEQDAVEFTNRNFDYYFTFTIEKVYQITK